MNWYQKFKADFASFVFVFFFHFSVTPMRNIKADSFLKNISYEIFRLLFVALRRLPEESKDLLGISFPLNTLLMHIGFPSTSSFKFVGL